MGGFISYISKNIGSNITGITILKINTITSEVSKDQMLQ